MYIHWSLYSLMFTGFEILLLPPYTCLMAFLVQAHFQIAPTFPLNRTLSLMPLGPGLVPLFVHKAGSLREISISFFFFSFGILRKNNVFSTSKINRERKKKRHWKASRLKFPLHLKQISDAAWKRHPWANDSCVLCRGVIHNPLVCNGFLSLWTQAPQGFLHDSGQTVYFTNIRWGSLGDAAFLNSYSQSSHWRKKKIKSGLFCLFLNEVTSILNPALTISSLKH